MTTESTRNQLSENPIVPALLSALYPGLGHWLILKMNRRALTIAVIFAVLMLTGVLAPLAIIFWAVNIYDAYRIADERTAPLDFLESFINKQFPLR